MRDLVPSIMLHQQPGSHHLFRRLHAANRAIAARVIEPAGSADEASVQVSLTKRSGSLRFHVR
jgi:hypothetical protein